MEQPLSSSLAELGTVPSAPPPPAPAGIAAQHSPRRGGEGRQPYVPAGTATPQSRGRAGKGTQHPAPAGTASPCMGWEGKQRP
uniref:Uncharacterized protein n=1 Tax=Gopherus agassizii TaxID=38772 RepID=A0A452GNH6_9SAUR